MAVTNMMRADEIANGFNSVGEHTYWRAVIGGTRVNPEVHFNSRASMVRITYRIVPGDFTVSFSRTNVAFGDFMASIFRSLSQVLEGLKATGLPFTVPLEDTAALRVQYDPKTKAVFIHLANLGDVWLEAEPMPFKVPERKDDENSVLGLDGF